jgi:hypothetical protein
VTNGAAPVEPDPVQESVRRIVGSVGDPARRDVGGVEYRVEEVTWPVSPNADGSGSFACPHTALTLLREDAVMLDVRQDYWDGNRTYSVVGDRLGRWMRFRIGSPGARGWDLRLARDDDRAAFDREASAVARAFGLDP